MSADPMAEKYYTFGACLFCENNPINTIDRTGLSTHTDPTGILLAA